MSSNENVDDKSNSTVVSTFSMLNEPNDKIGVSSIVSMNDPSTLLLSSLSSSSSSSSNVINMIRQQQRRRQRLFISTRGDDGNSNNNSITPSTTISTTRESMLWFQSVRRDWLNSPRTPIQPIILPSITFEKYIDYNNNNNTTNTSRTNNNNNNNTTRIEHDYTKTTIDNSYQSNCWMNNNYTNTSSPTTPAINTTATTLSTNTQKNDYHNDDQTVKNDNNNKYRQRLIEFYQQYNPSKLNDNITMIDSTLQKYKDKEEELFQKLYKKYCNQSTTTNTTKDDIQYLSIPTNINPKRPIVFLEFEYNINNKNNNNIIERCNGTVQIQLFHDYTPFTVENFRCLCTGEKGMSDTIRLCYINTIIHRIVPNMCIQGGDITYNQNDTNSCTIGTGGRSIYPKMGQIPKSPIQTDLWGNFIDEIPFLSHSCAGLVSMANNGLNRNNSQFFITLRPLLHLNGKHVVFGKVIDGMNIVYDIATYNTTTTAATNKTQLLQQQSLFNDNDNQQPVRIIDCGEIRHDDNGDEIWIRASDMTNKNDNASKHDSNNTNHLDNDYFEPNQSNNIFGNSSSGSNKNDNNNGNKSASHNFGNERCDAYSSTIRHNGCDIDSTIKIGTMDSTTPLIAASTKDVSFCSTASLETTNKMNTTDISMFEDSTTENTVKVDEINTNRYNNPTETTEEKPIPLQLFSHSTEQSLSNSTNDLFDKDSSFDDNKNDTGSAVLLSDTTTILDEPDVNETIATIATIVKTSLPNVTTTTETEFTSSNDTEHKMDVICTSLDQPSPVTVTPLISTSSIPSTNSQSSNDESTTLVDISYCDTSHMSNAETIGSTVSTSSSVAEQIEWLHRLMDDAQNKLRQTRQKLEERIHIIKSRPMPSSLSSSSSLLIPHHETVTQQTIPSIPELYALNIPSAVYLKNNESSST